MTCKECVHFDICDSWYKDIEAQGLVVGEMSQQICEDFKNKADFIEVVRCKDCKYYEIHKPYVTLNCERDGKLIPMKPDDFCSYGERKEENE